MKDIIDLAQVYNTNTVSRQYLIPWISEKLGIHDNYVIVHSDIIHKPLSVINRFDTIILDASHNPMDDIKAFRGRVQTFIDKHKNKKVIVLSDDANEQYYTSYFHLPYSQLVYPIEEKPITYKFSCLNSVPKMHRLITLNKIYQHNLQDSVLHSFLWDKQEHSRNHLQTEYWKQDLINYTDEYDVLLLMKHTKLNDIGRQSSLYVNDHSVSSPAYNETALHVITESSCVRLFFSEKTWKPIYSGQLFLSINAPGSIKKLEQFGFDVFRDLIDHSYDEETDLVKRVNSCVSEIGRLNDNIIDIYHHTALRRKNNFLHLQSNEFKQLVEISV